MFVVTGLFLRNDRRLRPGRAGDKLATGRAAGLGSRPGGAERRGVGAVKVSDELRDLDPDLITDASDILDRQTLGIGEIPLDVALAWDVRAGVAAAHRDHHVSPGGQLGREPLRAAVRQVDAELAHDLDHRRMHATARVGLAAR